MTDLLYNKNTLVAFLVMGWFKQYLSNFLCIIYIIHKVHNRHFRFDNLLHKVLCIRISFNTSVRTTDTRRFREWNVFL